MLSRPDEDFKDSFAGRNVDRKWTLIFSSTTIESINWSLLVSVEQVHTVILLPPCLSAVTV